MDRCRWREADGPSLAAHPPAERSSTAKRFIFMMLCQSLKRSTRKPRRASKLLARALFLLRPCFVKELQSAQFRFADQKSVLFRKSKSLFSRPSPIKQ